MAKILSVNVGLPRQVVSDGQTVTTGIFKTPVSGRIKVRKLNLEGDGQADLSVHGGQNKAVYAYPSEHYAYWRRELPGMDLPWGMFGENLTIEGLTEDDAHIGDQLQIGSAVLMVTQPRTPCYKLGIRFGNDDMPERFLASGRTGFYLSVITEGELGTGDAVTRLATEENQISVSTIFRLYFNPRSHDAELMKQALQLQALPSGWRRRFEERLKKMEHGTSDHAKAALRRG